MTAQCMSDEERATFEKYLHEMEVHPFFEYATMRHATLAYCAPEQMPTPEGSDWVPNTDLSNLYDGSIEIVEEDALGIDGHYVRGWRRPTRKIITDSYLQLVELETTAIGLGQHPHYEFARYTVKLASAVDRQMPMRVEDHLRHVFPELALAEEKGHPWHINLYNRDTHGWTITGRSATIDVYRPLGPATVKPAEPEPLFHHPV